MIKLENYGWILECGSFSNYLFDVIISIIMSSHSSLFWRGHAEWVECLVEFL